MIIRNRTNQKKKREWHWAV